MNAIHLPALCVCALSFALPILAVRPVLAGTQSTVASNTAVGQVAAQAADTVIGFGDRALDIAWSGGDALPLPTGDGALARLAGKLPLEQLVSAGESAFNGQGYDAIVVAGAEIVDRVLRLADRPSGLRLQGATRTIHGMGPGSEFSGRGFSVGTTMTRAVADDLVAGATIALERSRITTGGDALFSQGWTGAAEFGWRATPDLLVSVTAGAGLINRSLSRDHGAATANPDARRGFIALHADHSIESYGFRLRPSATVKLTTEIQDAYRDSAGAQYDDSQIHYGELTLGLEVGYRFDLAGAAVDVYSNMAGDWDFVRPDHVTLTSMRWNDDMPAHASIAGGVALTSPTGFRSGFEVSNNAIGPEGLNATRLHASVTMSF